MLNIFNKTSETTTWNDYKQHEEIVDGNLVITIHRNSTIDDLTKSISDFMSVNGMGFKYKVTVSKATEVE